jgi:hypothetical protein
MQRHQTGVRLPEGFHNTTFSSIHSCVITPCCVLGCRRFGDHDCLHLSSKNILLEAWVARAKQNLLKQNLSCNMLYDNKYCWRHITKSILIIVGGILQSRYQVLLAAHYKADTKYCWRHITKPIPSTIGGTLQSRYQVLLAAHYKADTKYW